MLSHNVRAGYFHHKGRALNNAAAARAVNPTPYVQRLRGQAAIACLAKARADDERGQTFYNEARYPEFAYFSRQAEKGIAHVELPANFGLRYVGAVNPEERRDSRWQRNAEAPDHGWITDPHGDVFKDGSGLCYGVVYQLPGKRGHSRFVAGYQFGGMDGGPTLDFSRIFSGRADGYGNARDDDMAHDAARAADDMAKRAAEEEREYQTAWAAGSRYADLGAQIAEWRKAILALGRDRRAAKGVGEFPAICSAVRKALKRNRPMPAFILTGADAPAFQALDAFTQGYIEALFFTEEERLCEEGEGREMPTVAFNTATMESSFVGGNSYGVADLASEALASIIADCSAFQATPAWRALGTSALAGEEEQPDDIRAGRDFWYTRNGHGCGFWDGDWQEPHATALSEAASAMGGCDVYIGDDGKVHLS